MDAFLQQYSFRFAVILTVLAFAGQGIWLQRVKHARLPWMVWLLAAALLGLTWSLAERAGEREEANVEQHMRSFAALYASEMDRQGHWKLPVTAAADDPLYLQLVEDEKRWLSLNPSVDGIYTLRRRPGGKYVLIVNSEKDSDDIGKSEGARERRMPIGERYEQNDPGIETAFSGLPVFEVQPFTDRWRTWVSAFVPLHDPRGKVEGVLGVDFEAGNLLRSIAAARTRVVNEMAVVLVVLLGSSTLTEVLRSDARERKRTIEALNLSEQHFRQVVHALPTALSVYDATLGLTLYNKAAEVLWGSAPRLDSPTGPGGSKVMWPDGTPFPEEIRPVSKALREGASTRGLELLIERPDGSRSYALSFAEPIQDGQNRVTGAVLMAMDLTMRREMELRLAEANRKLVEISREAGMAEVATNVLHNVGNVLNSANVALEVAAAKVSRLRSESLQRVATLLRKHEGDLVAYVQTPQGGRLPAFLSQLSEHFAAEKTAVAEELVSLRKHIEHINRIVAMQQSYASPRHALELLPIGEVIDDALHLNSASLERHRAEVVRDFDPALAPFPVDRHRLIQILVNLIQNAKQAMDEGAAGLKRLTLRTRRETGERVCITVSDTGPGIPAENLARIFEHGFTTRMEGHGFGLHACALAAREMGGSLTVASAGLSRGAAFTLELPLHPRTS